MQGLLPAALTELQTTLALDANNSRAMDLLLEISMAVTGAVEVDGDNYVFLALTATPQPATPYANLPTRTPEAESSETVTPNQPAGAANSPLGATVCQKSVVRKQRTCASGAWRCAGMEQAEAACAAGRPISRT